MFSNPQQVFALLPAWLRQRDAQNGGTLAQLVGVIGAQAVLLDQDLDRMYANWFVETCDEWVVPYLGDLLGYVPMPGAASLEQRSPALAQWLAPRREVGQLIAQRRRKGTLAMLAELARDQAGWPALAVEFYTRVAAAQHLDHPHPERLATADIRGAQAPAPGDIDALSTHARLADVRRIGNPQSPGRYGLANLGLVAFRACRFTVTRTTAYCREDVGAHCYTFSALGDDVPLWRDPLRADDALPTSIDDVPLAILRAALEAAQPDAHGRVTASASLYGAGRALNIETQDWPARGASGSIAASRVLPADLSAWSYEVPKGHLAVDPQLGRLMFRPDDAPQGDVIVSYGYGGAMTIGGGEYARPPIALPEHFTVARVRSAEAGPPAAGEYGDIGSAIDGWQAQQAQPVQAAAVKEEVSPATLIVELVDSGVYRGRFDVELAAGQSVFLVAAPLTRPVLWLADDKPGASDFISVRGDRNSRFVIDGVMIAGRGISFGPVRAVAPAREQEHAAAHERERDQEPEHGAPSHERVAHRHEPARDPPPVRTQSPSPAAPLALNPARRDLCQIVIRHSSLVPGWAYRRGASSSRLAEASLVLDGTTASVRIEASIVGAIRVLDGTGQRDPTPLAIVGSIVDALSSTHLAIAGATGRTALARLAVARSTIVGRVHADSIDCAENSLFTSHVGVARRQQGCMRYCYVPSGSRTPRRHACQPDSAIQASANSQAGAARIAVRVAPVFVSTRYGTPGYLRLAPDTPPELTGGADDAAELGAYHDLFEAQRLALLSARLAEFVPADIDAAVIFAT